MPRGGATLPSRIVLRNLIQRLARAKYRPGDTVVTLDVGDARGPAGRRPAPIVRSARRRQCHEFRSPPLRRNKIHAELAFGKVQPILRVIFGQ
jgi:hypothetical protein